jgi:hypothetical protein
MAHHDQVIMTELTANTGKLVMVCDAARFGTTVVDLNFEDMFRNARGLPTRRSG